jgi:hypothetical protein
VTKDELRRRSETPIWWLLLASMIAVLLLRALGNGM